MKGSLQGPFSKIFTLLGSIAGIAALTWNISWTVTNAENKFLQMTLEVKKDGGNATVLTTIENKGELEKKITYAGLIVSPDDMDLHSVIRGLRECMNEEIPAALANEPEDSVMKYLPVRDEPRYCDGGLAIVPLPFFYKQQRTIADERLSCRSRFLYARLTGPPDTVYAVRFIVNGEGKIRTTLDLLLINSAK
ncbi:MAG TPA: hypothetical protein VLK33_22400 [Terriglobales bacterium]|nr:hypothetical protein [Terriglobales bacterium]